MLEDNRARDMTTLGNPQHRSAAGHGAPGRHRSSNRRMPPRHRPGRYEVHRVRARSQTLTMVVAACVGLVLLVAFVELVEGGREGVWYGAASTGGDEPWK